MSTAASRVGDVRSPRLFPVLIGLSLLVAASLLYVTRYMNFFWDEWDFISYDRSWNVNLLLLPHNEHWSTIPILVWKLLFVVVGIRSHIPYEAALLVVHVAAVSLMFALVRRRSGDLPAFAASITLLVLGSGGTDIVWAFQIGFVGSVVFGLLAMLLFDDARPSLGRIIGASAALLASLMCSGVGLAFLAAVGAELLFDAQRRRDLVVLVVPVLAFGIWFLAFGAGITGTPGAPCPTCLPTGFRANFHNGPITLDYFLTLGGFVFLGAANSLAGIIGLPGVGIFVLPILAAVIAFQWLRSKGIESWQLGMAAGLVAWFTLVGLGRASTGLSAAADAHYLYVGAVFLLPLVAYFVRSLPWRNWWRPPLIAAFALALMSNALQLRDLALSQVDLMRTENAELQTAQAFRGAPDLALDRSLDPKIMPQLTARTLFAASSQLGSPVPLPTLETLRQLPRQAVDFEMVNLFGETLTVTADRSRSMAGLPCQTVDSRAGSTMDILVSSGQSIALVPSRNGEAWIFLTLVAPPTSEPLHKVALVAETPEWVHLPVTGSSALWRLRVQTTNVGAIHLCGNATLEINQAGGNVYRAEAEDGVLSPGWSIVADGAASRGRAAKLAGGTSVVSFKNDAFGTWTVPNPGLYDVWYRVRVTNPAGSTPEMTLGLWDGTARTWVASMTFAPNQADTSYSWAQAATGVSPSREHYVQFLATFTAQAGPATLSTDWFVDEAVLVPIGFPVPAT